MTLRLQTCNVTRNKHRWCTLCYWKHMLKTSLLSALGAIVEKSKHNGKALMSITLQDSVVQQSIMKTVAPSHTVLNELPVMVCINCYCPDQLTLSLNLSYSQLTHHWAKVFSLTGAYEPWGCSFIQSAPVVAIMLTIAFIHSLLVL